MHNHSNQEQTDQLCSDIDSSLLELEQLQRNYVHPIPSRTAKIFRSQSLSPVRQSNWSPNIDRQKRGRSTTPKVSFQDDSIMEKLVILAIYF